MSAWFSALSKVHRSLGIVTDFSSNTTQRLFSGLLERDEYPSLSRGLFALPDLNNPSVTFRAQVIHFGGSCSGLEFGEVPRWLEKFEQLLARLYWYRAEAHFLTEFMGEYRYSWHADSSIFEIYAADLPSTSHKWVRKQFAGDEPMPFNP